MTFVLRTAGSALVIASLGCGSTPGTVAPHDAAAPDSSPVVDAAPPDPGRIALLEDPTCYPFGLALDAKYVYYTCAAVGTVNRMPKLGGPVEVLATGRPHPHRISVANGVVAWGEYGGPPYFLDGAVVTLPATGGTPTVVAGNLRRVADVVWDSGELYFLENGTLTDHYFADGELWKISNGTLTSLASKLDYPARVALDATNAYVALDYAGSIVSCARSGCGGVASALATGFDEPWGVAVLGPSLFFTESHGGRVLVMPTTGGPATELEVSRGLPSEIVLNGGQLFWTEDLTREVNRSGLDGGTFDTLSSVSQAASALAVDSSGVFFADEQSGSIVRLPR